MSISVRVIGVTPIDRSNVGKSKMEVPDSIYTSLVGDKVPSSLLPDHPIDSTIINLSHCVSGLMRGEYELDYDEVDVSKEHQIISVGGVNLEAEVINIVMDAKVYPVAMKIPVGNLYKVLLNTTNVIACREAMSGRHMTCNVMTGLPYAIFEPTELSKEEFAVFNGMTIPVSNLDDICTAVSMRDGYDRVDFKKLLLSAILNKNVTSKDIIDLMSQMALRTACPKCKRSNQPREDVLFEMTEELYETLFRFIRVPHQLEVITYGGDIVTEINGEKADVDDYVIYAVEELVKVLAQEYLDQIDSRVIIGISYDPATELINISVTDNDGVREQTYDLIHLLLFHPAVG